MPNPSLPVTGGAIQPWQGTRGSSEYFDRLLIAVAEAAGFDPHPLGGADRRQRRVVLYGAGEQVYVRYKNRYGRTRAYHTTFEGVVSYLNRRYAEAESDSVRERVESYMREVPCPTCNGTRLRPESLAVTVAGRNIAEVAAMSVGEAAAFFTGLELSDRDAYIADRVLKEINARLGFLLDVGLDYLSIDRASATLAGGEAQRIRLATQIGSGLTGVLYVLDEPSIGLHQRDNHRLIETLVRLRDLGNTLIVVEHDEATIRTADYLVDIGPGAGEHGGQIVAEGALADLERRGVPDRPVHGRQALHRRSRPAGASRGALAGAGRGARAQPQGRHRPVPPRGVHLRHRGVRVGQVDPGQRRPAAGADGRPCTGRGPRRAATGR